MSNIFEDAVDATLNGWTINGTSLKGNSQAKQEMSSLLQSLGLDTWLSGKLAAKAAAPIAAEAVPVWYSGVDFKVVEDFKKLMSDKGIVTYSIGDTNWGQFVQGLDGTNTATAKAQAMLDAIQNYAETKLGGRLQFNGADVSPRGFKNIFFNYGSPDFTQRAIASGIPGRAILELR